MNIDALSKSSGSRPAASQQQQLGQEDFLKLMLAQFQNQDPFKPMENGEFLGQMAQFSTVQGLDDLNNRFESLATSLGDNQAIGAVQLIGREAMFESSQFALAETGDGATAALDTSYPGTVTVEISDAAGQLVRRMNVESDPAGGNRFAWDGVTDEGTQAEAGVYNIRAYTAIDGQETAIALQVAARINGISLGGAQGATLNVAGLGERRLSEVHEVI